MKTPVETQSMSPVHRTHTLPSTGGHFTFSDNRPLFQADASLVAAIQRSSAVGNESCNGREVVMQRKSAIPVIQRFPSHLQLIVKGGAIISASELLQILQYVTEQEIRKLQQRDERDWFRRFAAFTSSPSSPSRQASGGGAYPADNLPYEHTEIDKKFSLDGVVLIHSTKNHYLYVAGVPKEKERHSYPDLSKALPDMEESERATYIRSLIRGGFDLEDYPEGGIEADPMKDQTSHENQALAVAALFGAETIRSPREFLANMMLLDRMESKQTYGREERKKLSFACMLNPKSLESCSGRGYGDTRRARFIERHSAQPPILDSIVNAEGKKLSEAKINSSVYGGKSPMAGGGTLSMGRAPLPATSTSSMNLVQAKEVEVLYHWLRLQIGMDELAKLSKPEALDLIKELVEKRLENYDLMRGAGLDLLRQRQREQPADMGEIVIRRQLIPMLRALPAPQPMESVPSVSAPSFSPTGSGSGHMSTLSGAIVPARKSSVASPGREMVGWMNQVPQEKVLRFLNRSLESFLTWIGQRDFSFRFTNKDTVGNQLYAHIGELADLFDKVEAENQSDEDTGRSYALNFGRQLLIRLLNMKERGSALQGPGTRRALTYEP